MKDPLLCVLYLRENAYHPHTLGQFQQTLMALSKGHSHVWKLIQEIHEGTSKGTIPSHNIGPGDWVWVK